MRRTACFTIMTCLLGLSVPMGAQNATLPSVDLHDRLECGSPISVDLSNGQNVQGIVAKRQSDGFWIEHPPDEPTFVRYADLRLLRDPASNNIIGTIRPLNHGRPAWVTPTEIGVTALVIVVVATKGLFPFCGGFICFR